VLQFLVSPSSSWNILEVLFGYINRGISKSAHGGAEWYDMILEF
jgi:hypothetical protein